MSYFKKAIITATFALPSLLMADNVKLTGTGTANGSYKKITTTVEQRYYIKCTAMVGTTTNGGGTAPPPPVSTSLAGRWLTVDEAKNAFSQAYNIGNTYVSGAISVDPLGPPERVGTPTTVNKEQSEMPQPKSQAKITAETQMSPPWYFTEWVGPTPPTDCLTLGNSSSPVTNDGNKTTTIETIEYTWVTNWKKTQ